MSKERARKISEYQSVNKVRVKKVKIKEFPTTEIIHADENGHIQCYPGQILGNYEIGFILGEGEFGRVLHAKNCVNGQNAALKVLKNTQAKREAAMAEIIALTIIGSRDPTDKSLCIKMVDWFNLDMHICISFPLLGLSVYDSLKENNFVPYPIDQVRHISYQLCFAVAFLHKNGMTHTDLKPENIMFVNSDYTTVFDNEKRMEVRRIKCTNIRLIDFGNVTGDEDLHSPLITTRYYRAPEVILELGWTHSCDMWSIGCTIIEIYSGNLLFPLEGDLEHLAMMEKSLGPIPLTMANATKTAYFKNGLLTFNWNEADEDIKKYARPLKHFQLSKGKDDEELFDLIEKMLEYEPSKRLSSREALVQQFFNKLPSHQRI